MLQINNAPERVGSAHVLVVDDYDPDLASGGLYVEHHDDCPAWGRRVDGEWTVTGWDCAVGWHVEAAGIEAWFVHANAGASHGRECLTPGRYVIEPYTEHIRTFDFDEWEGGLALVGPENRVHGVVPDTTTKPEEG